MEHPAYIAIWTEHSNTTACSYYGFAVKDDLDQEHCTCSYTEVELTAEEVGQLLGGS